MQYGTSISVRFMLKSVDQVLKPDPLVASTCGRDGRAPLTVEEHHYAVAQITLSNSVPAVADEAFDRARNAFLYACFSYDLGALAEISEGRRVGQEWARTCRSRW